MKVQNLSSLITEMKQVALGVQQAPPDAAEPSFESLAPFFDMFAEDHRLVLRIIRDAKPRSIHKLRLLSGLSSHQLQNVLTTLKLIGMIKMVDTGYRRIPVLRAEKIVIEFDPFTGVATIKAGSWQPS